MMTMADFVLSCLYFDGKVYDEYENAFDVDTDEEDVIGALEYCSNCGDYKMFGSVILTKMFEKVIGEYSDVLDIDKFDWDFSSPSYPHFYYDNESISSRADLDEIVERLERKEE